MTSDTTNEIPEVLPVAKQLATRYRELTGKALGVTGEIAEFEASRILSLELTPARTAGYEAIRKENGVTVRL